MNRLKPPTPEQMKKLAALKAERRASAVSRIPHAALKHVEEQLQEYGNAVYATTLTEGTKAAYWNHARSFVRWLKYDFEPGSHGPTGMRVSWKHTSEPEEQQ